MNLSASVAVYVTRLPFGLKSVFAGLYVNYGWSELVAVYAGWRCGVHGRSGREGMGMGMGIETGLRLWLRHGPVTEFGERYEGE